VNPPLRPLLQWLSPAGAGARLSVFIFHRVHAQPDPLFPDEPDAAAFDALCARLAAWFDVLPLHEAVQRLAEGRLPARAAAITFDDGYADNHDVAMPVLQRHGLCATFFIATGFLDGGQMWNDRVIEAVRASPRELGHAAQRRALIDSLLPRFKHLMPEERDAEVAAAVRSLGGPGAGGAMMSSQQVRALRRGGMQVGAHTVNHPILARLPRDQAQREIEDSRCQLQALLDEDVTLFAYPNGRPGADYNAESVALVRQAGFCAAVSTAWGAAAAGADLFQIPRFTPWRQEPWRFGAQVARNLRRTGQTVADVSPLPAGVLAQAA
jgi:peptidoglycan/xylan/chitin deacetylase (PgdA/CDA1 family)